MSAADYVRRGELLVELAQAAARFQEQCRDHDEYQRRVVVLLRDAGATWEDVGEALGISKQSAWGRFR